MSEDGGDPGDHFAFGIASLLGELGNRRARHVVVHEGLEEGGLRAERPKERDFVDARLDGDEAGRGAAKAVLSVDTLGGSRGFGREFP